MVPSAVRRSVERYVHMFQFINSHRGIFGQTFGSILIRAMSAFSAIFTAARRQARPAPKITTSCFSIIFSHSNDQTAIPLWFSIMSVGKEHPEVEILDFQIAFLKGFPESDLKQRYKEKILRGHNRCIDFNRYDLFLHKSFYFHLFPLGL